MWDADNNTCVNTFSFPDTLENQQLGCLWQGEHLLSLNLNGDITYLDEANPAQPKRVVKGHLKNLTALAVLPGGERFYAASSDGRASCYDVASGECTLLGAGYGCNVTSLELVDGGLQATCYDDTISLTPLDAPEISSNRLTLPSQPRQAATTGAVTVVACVNHVVVVKDGKVVSSTDVAFEPLSVAVSPDGSVAAVGGKNKSIRIYSISGDRLEEKQVVEASGSVECLGYSPCGKFLASGDGGRNVFVWDVADYSKKMSRWKYHNSKIVSLAWTSDSKHIAS
jgi:WD40 repeat protein